jgi:uncharacterized protein (TIGR02001 family)
MKTKTLAGALALCVACIATGHAEAASSTSDAFPYGTVSGNMAVVNDYRFRGITRTGERAALQGSLRWQHDSGFYLGAWGSNVNLHDNNEATLETDVMAGYRYAVSGIMLDLGVTGYLFPGANSGLNYNFWEAKIAGSYELGFATLNAGVHYSPDYFRGSRDSLYSEIGVSMPVMQTGVTAKAGYGYQMIQNNTRFGGISDYGNWTGGLSYKWNGFDFSADYVDTSISKTQCRDGCDATGIVSVSKNF